MKVAKLSKLVALLKLASASSAELHEEIGSDVSQIYVHHRFGVAGDSAAGFNRNPKSLCPGYG
jgi:hypothetical protein